MLCYNYLVNSIKFFPGFATTNAIWDGLALKTNVDSVIGWSMGCFDAVREKTDKLVLVSGTPKFIKDETFPHGLSKALFRNLERKIQADLDSGLRFFYDLVGINFSARFKKDEIFDWVTINLNNNNNGAKNGSLASVF